MRFERPRAFRSKIVKLILRFILKDIIRNIYYIYFVNLEDLEAKLR